MEGEPRPFLHFASKSAFDALSLCLIFTLFHFFSSSPFCTAAVFLIDYFCLSAARQLRNSHTCLFLPLLTDTTHPIAIYTAPRPLSISLIQNSPSITSRLSDAPRARLANMSDADKHDDQYLASPAAAATPTKGRGGTRGRGRGRGRRRAVGKIRAPVPPKKPVPGGRRGRIKQYTDPHVQAAYERQREVKSTYLAIISHVKPALEELAARSIETLKSDPEAHKKVPEYRAIMDELARKRRAVMTAAKTWYDVELADLEESCVKDDEFALAQFRVSIPFFRVFNVAPGLHLHRFYTSSNLCFTAYMSPGS